MLRPGLLAVLASLVSFSLQPAVGAASLELTTCQIEGSLGGLLVAGGGVAK